MRRRYSTSTSLVSSSSHRSHLKLSTLGRLFSAGRKEMSLIFCPHLGQEGSSMDGTSQQCWPSDIGIATRLTLRGQAPSVFGLMRHSTKRLSQFTRTGPDGLNPQNAYRV